MKTSQNNKSAAPVGYDAEVLSHCDAFEGPMTDGLRCSGVFLADGSMQNTCGDPCSFIMRKAGSGNPPFLTENMLINEIEKLMLRRSRGTLRKD